MRVSKIISITYNWFYTTDIGEQYQEADVDKNNVVLIQEGVLGGEAFYEVTYGNDRIIKVLNVNTVVYKLEISKKRG